VNAAAADSSTLACVISPFLTCEEAFLLASFMKGLSKNAILGLGPVPVQGQDDTYPKDRMGRPAQPIKFTIRAEKCPNHEGVAIVLRHFQGEVISFDSVLERARQGNLQALYIAASYPRRAEDWISEEEASHLRRLALLVVQDLFPTPASQVAHAIIPGSTFAEKEGTYVNHAGLAQSFTWAIRPPRGVRTDGQIFLDLLERRGLWHGATIRAEMAKQIEAFAPLANEHLDENGTLLNL